MYCAQIAIACYAVCLYKEVRVKVEADRGCTPQNPPPQSVSTSARRRFAGRSFFVPRTNVAVAGLVVSASGLAIRALLAVHNIIWPPDNAADEICLRRATMICNR